MCLAFFSSILYAETLNLCWCVLSRLRYQFSIGFAYDDSAFEHFPSLENAEEVGVMNLWGYHLVPWNGEGMRKFLNGGSGIDSTVGWRPDPFRIRPAPMEFVAQSLSIYPYTLLVHELWATQLRSIIYDSMQLSMQRVLLILLGTQATLKRHSTVQTFYHGLTEKLLNFEHL